MMFHITHLSQAQPPNPLFSPPFSLSFSISFLSPFLFAPDSYKKDASLPTRLDKQRAWKEVVPGSLSAALRRQELGRDC